MIVSNNPNRVKSRWLQLCTLLCAIVVLPLGIASAHDYEAVGKRLKKSVKKGEITQQQADAMMATLKKKATKSKSNANLESTWNKLQAMVKAGKLTKEEATAKMSATKKEAAKKDTDYEAIGKKIRAAVQAGKITKEEGRAKMAAIKKGHAKKVQGSERVKAHLANVKKELAAAVEAGRITKEDAAKRYEGAEKAVKERMAMAERGERSITVEEYRRAEAKMRKMVEDGEAKPEHVERRLIEMRKMMAEQTERGEKSTRREDGGMRDVDWEGIKNRIEAAVKSGDMTREEAEAKYKEIKQRMGRKSEDAARKSPRKQAKDQDKELDYDAIGKKIKAAVKAGKMTEEEAEAKWVEIKKKAAAKIKDDD